MRAQCRNSRTTHTHTHTASLSHLAERYKIYIVQHCCLSSPNSLKLHPLSPHLHPGVIPPCEDTGRHAIKSQEEEKVTMI